MRRSLASLLLLLSCAAALADGGALRLHAQAGVFIISLFTTPDPLRVGQADFSVAVEKQNVDGLDEDAHVSFVLTPVSGQSKPLILSASRSAATSRFLQAANFSLPHSGLWHVKVVVQDGNDVGEASTEVDVLPSSLVLNNFAWQIAVVPLAALLFGIHQRRKRAFRRTALRPKSLQPPIRIR